MAVEQAKRSAGSRHRRCGLKWIVGRLVQPVLGAVVPGCGHAKMMTGVTQGDKEGGPPARRLQVQAATDCAMTDPTTSEPAPGVPTVSLVVPAFNEELRLPPTLKRLVAELDDVVGPTWELVVSDDGSSDRTAEVALDAARSEPRIVVVTNPVNQGKGAALVDGFAAATAPVVVFLDADLPVEPGALGPLVAAVGDADVVVGSRRPFGDVLTAAAG
jgi:hypothetical protein